MKLTPIEKYSDFYLKREDQYREIKDIFGTKARSCLAFSQEAGGLTTAHTKEAPQAPVVSAVARHLDIPCRIHTTENAIRNMPSAIFGAPDIIIHPDGTELHKVVQYDAELTKFKHVGPHIDCTEARETIIDQCANMPGDIKTIIVPGRNDTTAVSIFAGLKKYGIRAKLKILCLNKPDQIINMFKYFGDFGWEKETEFFLGRNPKGNSNWFYANQEYFTPGSLVWIGTLLEGDTI